MNPNESSPSISIFVKSLSPKKYQWKRIYQKRAFSFFRVKISFGAHEKNQYSSKVEFTKVVSDFLFNTFLTKLIVSAWLYKKFLSSDYYSFAIRSMQICFFKCWNISMIRMSQQLSRISCEVCGDCETEIMHIIHWNPKLAVEQKIPRHKNDIFWYIWTLMRALQASVYS